nr:TolC family protein [Brucepastera parasyntrophica]
MIIDLEKALQFALDNNQDLKKQKISYLLSDRQYKFSWNNFLPSLSLSGSLKNTHAFPNAPESTSTGTDLSVSGGISLSLSPGVPTVIQQARISQNTASLQYAQAEATLVRAVKKPI